MTPDQIAKALANIAPPEVVYERQQGKIIAREGQNGRILAEIPIQDKPVEVTRDRLDWR